MSSELSHDPAREAAVEILSLIKTQLEKQLHFIQFHELENNDVDRVAAIIARHCAEAKRGSREAFESMGEVMRKSVAFKDACTASPRIVAAAYIRGDEILSLPRPARHCHLIWAYGDMRGSDSGFVTDQGEFVDRETAYRVAVAAGQVMPKPEPPSGRNRLFSEDIW